MAGVGIATKYLGITFRSRLEARWAAMFGQIGWDWSYEPIDARGYIPDFMVKGDRPFLIEVKPALVEAEYRAPVDKIVRGIGGGVWPRDVLVLGTEPITTEISTVWEGEHIAGLLGEHYDGAESDDGNTWWWEAGNWANCQKCGRYMVWHSEGWYIGRPCGHHDGDHYLGPVDPTLMTALWRHAGELVRWTGR